MASWNPWHGCHKYSQGCAHCYVYRMDEKYQRDASLVRKTGDFNLPVRKSKKTGDYQLPPGSMVWTCFTSDFFLEDADPWRPEAWAIIRERRDCRFLFITKRILRFYECIPPDWGNGYENVHICCTMENQLAVDERLPFFRQLPIRYKSVICEPLLGPLQLQPHLGPWAQEVLVGGESGLEARPCDYAWVLQIREQCIQSHVSFTFRQTGYRLVKDGICYLVPRKYQHAQARKAGIDISW